MHAKKNVLVVGATGHLGQHLPQALQERGMSVHALVRPETLASLDPEKRQRVADLIRRGVVIHEGALDDPAAVLAACQAVQVVVSALSPTAMQGQGALLAAIQEAGTVERFVPSEFGLDPWRTEPGRCLLLDMKRGFQDAVKDSGVGHTFIYANGFASYWAGGLGQLGLFAPPSDNVMVFGDGTVKGYLVAPADIARYVAAIVADAGTMNREVAISPPANLVSQSDMIGYWERRTGASLQRTVVSAEALDGIIDSAAGDPARMMELIGMQLAREVWIDGNLGAPRDGVLEATERYPAMRYQTVTRFLDAFANPPATVYPPVQAYLDAMAAGDADAVAACFDADFRSDQPLHPERTFAGRETVRGVYRALFDEHDSITAPIVGLVIGPEDADGVAAHSMEVTYDLNRRDGKTTLCRGVILFGATRESIRWGRLYVEGLANADMREFPNIIDGSRA